MKIMFLVTLLCLLFTATLRAQTVWVEPSLSRVGQTQVAGSGTVASISAAKGEYESFQVIVRGPGVQLTNVNLTVSALDGPGAATIPASAYTLYRAHYINVPQSSADWEGFNQPLGAGLYADALIPFLHPDTGAALSGATYDAVPATIASNTNQPFWVDLLVPDDAVAGAYTGTFSVTSTQGNVNGSVELVVRDFTLPLKSTLRSAFLVWGATVIQTYKELLRNRMEPHQTTPAMQGELITNYGLGDVGLPFWSGADMDTCTMSSAPSVASIEASRDLQDGVLLKYAYVADEIDSCPSLDATVKLWAQNMHTADVDQLIVMVPKTSLLTDGSGSGRSAVDIWVVLPFQHQDNTAIIEEALAKGDSVWSYNTLVQDAYSPKMQIDFLPINWRIHNWINQTYGLTGFLQWKIDHWPAGCGAWAGQFVANAYPGDGFWFYPGGCAGIPGVAPSMRAKWFRDGVEDYEYVEQAKLIGKGAEALAIVATVAPDWTDWTRDTELLLEKRDALADLLETELTESGVLTYAQNDTTDLLDPSIVPCDSGTKNRGMMPKSPAGSSAATLTAGASAANEILLTYQNVPNGITWAAGTWTVRLNVTTANSNIAWDKVWVSRYDSATCTFQEDLGSTSSLAISLGTTGVKTASVTGSSGTPVAGDTIVVGFEFDNGVGSTQNFGITPNVNIDSPFTLVPQIIMSRRD